MGHSGQQVGEKVEFFNDLDLIALVGLMHEQLESRPDELPAVVPWVTRWQRDLEGYGPGCIDLKLEDLTLSVSARAELVSLLAHIDQSLRGFGETVPAQILNNRCHTPGVVFCDYKTSHLTAALHRWQALLAISTS